MNIQERTEMVEKVIGHLREQGVRATTPDNGFDAPACQYRGANGTKCAVGFLIPDEIYEADLEGHGVSQLPLEVLMHIGAGDSETLNTLSHLQGLHDRSCHWTEEGICEDSVQRCLTQLRIVGYILPKVPTTP